MKNLFECEEFTDVDSIDTLNNTSKDKRNGVYMTNSTISVINFDAVKDKYTSNLSLTKHPKSIDAMVIKSESKATLIEFKNGVITDREAYGIRRKVYDSILIFTDITDATIKETRDNIDYILVYNSDKNSDPKTKYPESKNRDDIGKILLGYGRKKLIKFGLEMFEGYCFKEVCTYNQEEFEQEFVNKIQEEASC